MFKSFTKTFQIELEEKKSKRVSVKKIIKQIVISK